MRFENDEDRRRQERAVKAFGFKFNLDIVESDEWSSVDYQLKNNNDEFVCGFEVKGCKNQKIADKDFVLVSMRKITDGQQFQVTNKIPLIICWAFDDGILFQRLNKLSGEFKFGGRKPRAGSTFDQEMMTYIKQELLENILY